MEPTHSPAGGARLAAAGFLVVLAALSLAGPGWARPGTTENLAATRPEAWAMRWFDAVATPTAFGVAEKTEAWSVDIGLEGGLIPALSAEERRVGFSGTKVEDINRSPVFGRPVVRLGLPGDLSLSASWVPPIELGGVTPDILSFALARPLWTGERGRLGAQLFYLDGRIDGDISCPKDEVAAGNDPVANPFLCEEVSNDTMAITSWGLELGYAWRAAPTVELFFSGLWQELSSEFQVRALYDGFRDRNKLLYSGGDWAATAGLGWQTTAKLRLAGELFYAPLDVVRDPTGHGPTRNDPLFNARLLATFKLR